MKEKLQKLINVKSIITILLTLVFSYLAITEKVSAEQFVVNFTIIIGFYFGTQSEKKKGSDTDEGR